MRRDTETPTDIQLQPQDWSLEVLLPSEKLIEELLLSRPLDLTRDLETSPRLSAAPPFSSIQLE